MEGEPYDVNDAREALTYCHVRYDGAPDSGYNDWKRLLAAGLAAGLSDDELGEWSKGEPGYTDALDVTTQLKSLRKHPLDKIGAGTLFHRAKEGGWRPPRRDPWPPPRTGKRPPKQRLRQPKPPDTRTENNWRPVSAVKQVERITLLDILMVHAWILVDAERRPLTHDGRAWRQSLDTANGGIRLARFGGELVGTGGKVLQVQPWLSWPEAKKAQREHGGGCGVALSLAGDDGTPYDLPIAIIDLDYKPNKAGGDPEGKGKRAAGLMRDVLKDLGIPVFTSRSREGAHGLFHLVDTPEAPDKLQPPRAGFTPELFIAGSHAKRHVQLRLDKQETSYQRGYVLPRLSLQDVLDQRKAALEAKARPTTQPSPAPEREAAEVKPEPTPAQPQPVEDKAKPQQPALQNPPADSIAYQVYRRYVTAQTVPQALDAIRFHAQHLEAYRQAPDDEKQAVKEAQRRAVLAFPLVWTEAIWQHQLERRQ